MYELIRNKLSMVATVDRVYRYSFEIIHKEIYESICSLLSIVATVDN